MSDLVDCLFLWLAFIHDDSIHVQDTQESIETLIRIMAGDLTSVCHTSVATHIIHVSSMHDVSNELDLYSSNYNRRFILFSDSFITITDVWFHPVRWWKQVECLHRNFRLPNSRDYHPSLIDQTERSQYHLYGFPHLSTCSTARNLSPRNISSWRIIIYYFPTFIRIWIQYSLWYLNLQYQSKFHPHRYRS